MNWNIHKTLAAVALPLISMSSALSAARNDGGNCEPAPPATCYPDDCCRTYCLGPDTYAVTAPVRPRTCNGDWVFTVAGFYWNAHQDGMEYAINDGVEFTLTAIGALNNIIDARFENPEFKWEFGYKLGLGYNSTCDGWDFGVVWTNYHGKASSDIQAELSDNRILLPLWSVFLASDKADTAPTFEAPTHASNIESKWNLDLNLVDFELGRESWLGRRVSLRPHIGLRYASIRQSYTLIHRGGSFSSTETNPIGISFNDTVDLDNDYKGVGIRGGLDTVWNFGCGWSIYGNTALSLIYGRFNIDHDEVTREAQSSFAKNKIYEAKDSFRATRLAVDLALGIQWSSLFCNCNYGFTAKLGWENHLFLDQNQLWRANTLLGRQGIADTIYTNGLPQKVFSQARGDLDTQGWTLTLVFDF